MNLKNILIGLLLIGYSQILYAQQDFKTGYDFGSTKRAKVSFKKLDLKTGKYISFDTTGNSAFRKGIILKRSEEGEKDTLFIKLWPVIQRLTASSKNNKQGKFVGSSTLIQNPKGDNRYIMEVDSYDDSRGKMDIPFSTWQLTEVTIPLRYNLSSGKMSS